MTRAFKQNNSDVRATCLNCIDGRVQLPILHWIREQYQINFVDVITAAGMDGVLASQDNIDEIIRSVNISVNINKSTRIFIVGHYDCRGNFVDEKTHREQLTKSVKRLKTYFPKLEIIGLWVNCNWQVEVWQK
ncbi:MAG: carbonic anhydrase [Candidatus Omnitrophota bacterium]|jgi:carbonic anhydrase